MTTRYKILAGQNRKYEIGDKIRGHEVTGFGKVWQERVTDDTACVWGFEPGQDSYPTVSVQYAYCKEEQL